MTARCDSCEGKYSCTGFFQRKQQEKSTDCEYYSKERGCEVKYGRKR